jgi:putative endonuclease
MERAGASKDMRKRLGEHGEHLAIGLLEAAGYRILERNWRCRSGELDIVAAEGSTLVFVEVRTRRNTGTFGTPQESVDSRKQAQVRKTAVAYLHQTGRHDSRMRFDLVAIELDRTTGSILHMQHVKNAF